MKLLKKMAAIGISAAMLTTGMPGAVFAASDSLTGDTVVSAESYADTGSIVTTSAVKSTEAVKAAAEDTVMIELADDSIIVDGTAASSDKSSAVYLSNDIKYYEDKDTYDSGNTYGEGTDSDKHSESEAAAHTVVNITKAGTYMISGSLSAGQIAVDLGDDAKTDPDAVVTLIFNGADITCTVAPAVIFYKVYESNQEWVKADDEGTTDSYKASSDVDTSDAGANVIIADGSVNNITGSHVAKVYKDTEDQKKKYKYDGAFYSRMSLNIDGGDKDTGILNIIADNEGLDSEMHLTINGGIVNIQSQDDGINTNEDGVSVTTINGGQVHIVAGLGSEGDGIDSNGYLVINGGIVISSAKPQSDSGLDSDCGSYINGGYVVATGSTMDWAESDSEQVTMNLQFAGQNSSDEAIIITDKDGKVIFAYDPEKDETSGKNSRGYQGAVVSCPEFEVGQTYNVYVGGDVNGTDVNGLYDASTVTGFTGSTLQQYTGTDIRGGFPGGFNGARPDMNGEWEKGDRPEPPEGFDPDKLPGDFQNGNRPDGNPPEMPADGSMPDGNPPADGQDNGQAAGSVTAASTEFYMNDKVNAFSGVGDYDASAASENQPAQDQVAGFKDVHESDWYGTYVSYVTEKGLFQGTSETEFSPDSNMSRAMIWTVLARLDGTDTAAAEGQSWYDKGRDWAMQKTVGQGQAVSDGSEPDASITREQLVTMLWRYAGCPEASDEAAANVEKYADSASVSEWADQAMSWAVEKGLIAGVDGEHISPDTSATRAQVAAIMQRYCEMA